MLVSTILLANLLRLIERMISSFSAQSKSENASKTGTRALGNQVIRKGHMCIQNLGIMKGKRLDF